MTLETVEMGLPQSRAAGVITVSLYNLTSSAMPPAQGWQWWQCPSTFKCHRKPDHCRAILSNTLDRTCCEREIVTNLFIYLNSLSHVLALVMKAVESGTYIHKIADYKSHSTIYTVCTLGTEVNKLWSHSAKTWRLLFASDAVNIFG